MLVPLTSAHAGQAARLHIAGQTGTFLATLGPDVLTVFYQALPVSRWGFGFASVETNAAGSQTMLGFVSATTGVGQLFMELGTRRIGRFLPPLARQFVQRPWLALQAVQTVAYPLLVGDEQKEEGVELLSIMVEPDSRGSGMGSALLDALLAECGRREIATLHVTVDSANRGARRFYERHGFARRKEIQLYGRPMSLYRYHFPPTSNE